MPSCEAIIGKGIRNSVSVTVFPRGSKVTFKLTRFNFETYKGEVIYEETKNAKGNVCEFVRPNEFNKENAFMIEVSCDGYKGYSNTGIFE